MRTRWLPIALVAVLMAPVLGGCAYLAGDEAVRDFDAWVEEHPLEGAEVTDRSGTNRTAFKGRLQADARLTAKPGRKTIVAAMASMCRFDDETSARTTYWLLVGEVWLQVPCHAGRQAKAASFWIAVHGLEGVEEIDLSPEGAYVEADDAALTAAVPTVSAAADRTGYVLPKAENLYRSQRITITQPLGADLTDQLALAQGVLEVVGTSLRSMEAAPGLVTAATTGTAAEARGWQQQVGRGTKQLFVTPARVVTHVALTSRGQDLLDGLSTRDGVTSVAVGEEFWTIGTPRTAGARAVLASLRDQPGAVDLGRLILDVGTTPRDPNTGEGRTCAVGVKFPGGAARGAALLDLCDLPGMVLVDDRLNGLSLRLENDQVRPMLAALHRTTAAEDVYLTMANNTTISFTTGSLQLTPEYPESTVAKQLVAIWNSLG